MRARRKGVALDQTRLRKRDGWKGLLKSVVEIALPVENAREIDSKFPSLQVIAVRVGRSPHARSVESWKICADGWRGISSVSIICGNQVSLIRD